MNVSCRRCWSGPVGRAAMRRDERPSAVRGSYPFSSSTGPVSAARTGSQGSVEMEPVREPFARRPGGPPHPIRRGQILRGTSGVCRKSLSQHRGCVHASRWRGPSQMSSSIALRHVALRASSSPSPTSRAAADRAPPAATDGRLLHRSARSGRRTVRRPVPQAPRWHARRPGRGPGRRRSGPRRVSRPRCGR